MNFKPLKSAAILLLPLLLIAGGKVYTDKFRTGMSVVWLGSTGGREVPFACDAAAILNVVRVSDGKLVSQTVCNDCECKAFVPAGKYELVINSPAYGSNAKPEKVEVHHGQIAYPTVYVNEIPVM